MPPKKKKDREEMLARKRKLEKERYERLKRDEAKLSSLKERKKEYYKTKKNEGKLKSIKELAPREQRSKRKQWKLNSKKYRNKKKQLDEQARVLLQNATSPDSEDEITPDMQQKILMASPKTVTPPLSDRRVVVGRQRALRNKLLKNKLLKQKDDLIHSLKSKLTSYQKKLSKITTQIKMKSSSPKSKIQQIIKRNSASEIKRTLLFGEVMKQQLTENYSKLKTQKEKQIFTNAVVGPTEKKYKVLLKKKILTHKRLVKGNEKLLSTKRKVRRDQIPAKTKEKIVSFLEQDNHSRICSGKKGTVSMGTEIKFRNLKFRNMI